MMEQPAEPADSNGQQSQQATQSTQQASQPQDPNDLNSHLWGYLQPCSSALKRIDFFKVQPTVTIGRNFENNAILPGPRVSGRHCRIMWDGRDDGKSDVVVYDLSSNGTYINGIKIGKGQSAVLKQGNEIGFGAPMPQTNPLEDYRFIYRHTAGGPPKGGLFAFYDIGHELGKGSFATVIKAVCRNTGKWYAIKMIQENKLRRATVSDGNTNTVESANTFAREIAILEQLDHPNICRLREVFFEPHTINLVLEFVSGGDLLEYILKSGGLAEPVARHITYQIADALSYIHAKGIVHRDLKPENVLLTKDVPPTVKVADFGLAKVVDSWTYLKTMCGTPNYLAPEVVNQQNHEGYDHLVDSWSVGVIVFSMLTSSSPFIDDERQRDMATRVAERKTDYSPLETVPLSAECKSFIKALLEYDPRRRMSLSAAKNHPWLRSLNPAPDHNQIRDEGPASSPPTPNIHRDDSSVLTPLTDDEAMDEDRPSDSVHSIVNENFQQLGISPRGRGRAPLQRRSQIIAHAAEDRDVVMPDPSWQMVAAQGLNDENGQGPSNRYNFRSNKRKVSNEGAAPPEVPQESDASQPEEAASAQKSRRGKPAARGKRRAGPGQRTAARGRARDPVSDAEADEEHPDDAQIDDEESSVPLTRRSPRKLPRLGA